MKSLRYSLPIILLMASATITGCHRLSSDAKQMIGDYYITDISNDLPVLELKSNGTVVQRAIKPGVLTYSVKGRWNVVNDSLVIFDNDTIPFDIEGDSTLIGDIPQRSSKAIVNFNGTSLTLRHDGADYVYYRRGHRE